MAERLADILGKAPNESPFSSEEEKTLEELGYIKKGFWWASQDGRMASKIELIEALKENKPQSPRADQYPLPFYMFTYDAKHKARLPVWDTFPVVMVTGSISNGFDGINIHYINPEIRMAVLGEIMSILDKGGSAAEALSVLIPFKEGYKKYLNSHIRTAKIPIPRSMWEEAFQTPGNFIYK